MADDHLRLALDRAVLATVRAAGVSLNSLEALTALGGRGWRVAIPDVEASLRRLLAQDELRRHCGRYFPASWLPPQSPRRPKGPRPEQIDLPLQEG